MYVCMCQTMTNHRLLPQQQAVRTSKTATNYFSSRRGRSTASSGSTCSCNGSCSYSIPSSKDSMSACISATSSSSSAAPNRECYPKRFFMSPITTSSSSTKKTASSRNAMTTTLASIMATTLLSPPFTKKKKESKKTNTNTKKTDERRKNSDNNNNNNNNNTSNKSKDTKKNKKNESSSSSSNSTSSVVSFNKNVQVILSLHRKDYTSEERHNSWYSYMEYKQMKRSIKQCLRAASLMKKDAAVVPDASFLDDDCSSNDSFDKKKGTKATTTESERAAFNEEELSGAVPSTLFFCLRGLEDYTYDGSKKQKHVRKALIHAVLEEQDHHQIMIEDYNVFNYNTVSLTKTKSKKCRRRRRGYYKYKSSKDELILSQISQKLSLPCVQLAIQRAISDEREVLKLQCTRTNMSRTL